MPAGLDGNPNPLVTVARSKVLQTVADQIAGAAATTNRLAVGVDGQSGAGKSTFADELTRALAARGLHTLRSTTDSFHRPRAERMQRGDTSAAGYYLDSHQLDIIVADLLTPFRDGAATVRVAAFDEPTDSQRQDTQDVPERAVLVFDGLFLHRPELRNHWDLSVYLEAAKRRNQDWLNYLLGDLPDDPVQRAAVIDERLERARWPRYRHGWHHYLAQDTPHERATLVIDNNDLAAPTLIR